MKDTIVTLIDKLMLWQLAALMSVFLLALGFTGETILGDNKIIAGREDMAIVAGLAFMAIAVLLRFIPPPMDRRRHENGRPKIAISPTQTALCSRLTEWTLFTDAAKLSTVDDKLPIGGLRSKNKELRLELATLQGLIMRRINDKGEHEVKYRYDDETNWTDPNSTERR